jgi:hypothetical protein
MKTIITTLIIFFSITAFSQKKLIATYSEQLNNGNFAPYDSVLFEYDANNRQAAWQSSYYSNTNSVWKNLLRYEYSYNPNGDVSSILVKLWSDTAWKVNSLNTYIYDNGLLKSRNITRWYNDKWNNSSKTEYFYSTGTEPDSTIYYNFSNNAFQQSAKNIYTYNTDGNITEDMDYFWDNNANGWFVAIRKSYTYNSKKLNTRIVYSEKAQVGWKTISTEEMTYDSDNDLRQIDTKDANGQITRKRVYIYNSPATGIQSLPSLNVKTYPNPASEVIMFEFSEADNYTVDLVNLEGKKISYTTPLGSNSYRINVSSLDRGIYFYSIKNNKEKIVKSGRVVLF